MKIPMMNDISLIDVKSLLYVKWPIIQSSQEYFIYAFVKLAPNGEPHSPGQGERESLWTPHSPNLPTEALVTPQKV